MIAKSDLETIYNLLDKSSIEDIKDIFELVRTAHNDKVNERNFQIKRQFSKGQKVKFTSKKYGNVIVGVITKINPKTIVVKTDTLVWRVSPQLLQAA